jgi:hypothetical protein
MSTRTAPTRRQCFLHADREAAARCMGCGQSFCRECVSEHDLRMLCAACLKKETTANAKKPTRRWKVPIAPVHFLLGLLILWFTVYLFGRILVNIPSSFHDGEMWPEVGPMGE